MKDQTDFRICEHLPVNCPAFFQLGEIQEVLVTEISHDKQYYVGHNKCYDQVSQILCMVEY